jgi:galactokinase
VDRRPGLWTVELRTVDSLERAHSALDSITGASGFERHAWFVPGRIEVLGKHTDYAGGRSLVCAIERGLAIVGSRRSDSRVRMVDANDHTSIEFDLSSGAVVRQEPWATYPITVGRRLSMNFRARVGADVAFASDLPVAAGLSSSSALIIATFLALADVNEVAAREDYARNIHDTLELASYLATIENGSSFGQLVGERGVGTQGGSEDHVAILCSKQGCVTQYSFLPAREERVIPVPDRHVFCVGASGVVAEKTGAARGSYNHAAACTGRILRLWCAASSQDHPTLAAALASATDAESQFEAVIDSLADSPADASAFKSRLAQFADESNRIIPAAGDALERGDIESFGNLVDRSQQNAETRLGNQVPETVALARSARELGAAAASAFGAGFGGSVWALVREGEAAEFCNRWHEQYLRRFPARTRDARFFVTRAAKAAHQLF